MNDVLQIRLQEQADGIVSITNMEQPKEKQNAFNLFISNVLDARQVITVNP